MFTMLLFIDNLYVFHVFLLFCRREEEGSCNIKEEMQPGIAAMDKVHKQSPLVVLQHLWW